MTASRSEPLPFNPEVLRWARERIGIPIETAAKRIHTSIERLIDWENPEATRRPTVKQGRKLAALYERPFLEFFASEIPNVLPVQLVPDFRFHRVPPFEIELIALRKIQRWAEEQRLNALDLFEIMGDITPKFPLELYTSLEMEVDKAAQKAREFVQLPIEAQFKLNSNQKRRLPDILRSCLSECGVLILKHSDLHKARTRGICLFAEPLPIIVYGNEAPSAQAFTIAHEFGHILLRQSAISGGPRFGNTTSRGKSIEGWCNRFAASFLIPRQALDNLIARPDVPKDELEDSVLDLLATRFSVSRHAMLIRLVNLGYVKPGFYWRIKRPIYLDEEENFKSPPMRPSYYGSRYKNSLGTYYTGLVVEAWETGAISSHNAAEFMGIKNVAHLDDIRRNLVG
ncbi:MAG: XRE family transcriptional regulator [Gammaproteobacteria bacterium]|nr:XRE family transcriptional regulator [Gammaproteobacteria bacterium]